MAFIKAEIISVGNELLTGTIVNTNTAFLARNLALMGFEVHRTSVIGDVEEQIIEAVVTASKRSHVTILTGGLGPTDDDLTKESVAKAFGLKLVKNDELEKKIRSYFDERGHEMTENNLKQAMVINGCEILENHNGTAPGVYMQTSKQAIVLLPGPPSELEPMFENEVKKKIENLCKTHSASASLHVVGIGESALEEKLKDLLYGENPTAALYAKLGEVHIDLVAHAKKEAEAKAILEDKISEIRERIGEYIYSENGLDLAETVVNLLKKTKTKIALAESCTGGMLAARITDIEGASKIFNFGMAAYSDAVKQKSLDVNSLVLKKFSAVSSATAAEMAKGARAKGDADIAVGITGVAGPKSDYVNKPVGLVYIAVADKKRVVVKKFNFGSSRTRATLRELSVINALDMVRRFVSGLEIENSRVFGDADLADVERNGKPRKKSGLAVQKAVTQGLLILLVLGGMFIGYQAIQSRLNQSIYNELKSERAGLQQLKSRNSDTEGWIAVDGSEAIDTVVVKGREDDYYKNHDFSGSSNNLGCLYVDTSIDLSSDPDNVVIYGTSNDPTQMFGPLLNYTDKNYLANNYLINFNSVYAENCYRVVSVLYANDNSEYGRVDSFYKTGIGHFETKDNFNEFVIQAKMRSVINIDADILSGDKFITLVTDTSEWDGAKLIVIARMIREAEWTEMTSPMFTANMAAAYPDEWYKINQVQPAYNEQVERDRWINWMLTNEKNAGNSKNYLPKNGGVGSRDKSGNAGVSIDKQGKVIITVYMNDAVVSDTPTAIVSKIVSYEMPAGSDEAIKALAVATVNGLRYSYENEGIPDVMGTTATSRITSLVESVIDKGIYFNGKVAFTPYFKISAGSTFSSSDVWGTGNNFPYLKSVSSRNDTGMEKSRMYSRAKMDIKNRLESFYKITLSDDYQNWIIIQDVGEGGVVKTVSIDGQVVDTGLRFTQECLSLESPRFDFYWMGGKEETLNITAYGVGHGVGLSQGGAEYMASQGKTYKEILEYYYTGVTISELNWVF